MTKVVVAMSGGVDSSVAAALLVRQGFDVTGMMLRLWSEPGAEETNRCCTPDAMALARRVAARLSIPFFAIDVREPFYENVVGAFLEGYSQGITPNPCLTCNRRLRWGTLLERARAIGADYLATGHYARVITDEDGCCHLLRGIDERKDQSYVLSVLNQEQLAHTLFPLGEFTKPQVREMAREFNLPVANRADSQDLCFLGSKDYRVFLNEYAPQANQPGEIRDRQGNVLGQHAGLANYTIGQRKGLGLASPKPFYVLGKDLRTNTLVVGTQSELGGNQLVAHTANWILEEPQDLVFDALVKIRYKAPAIPGKITILEGGKFRVDFQDTLRDITPGQAAVLYNGEEVLGNGIIQD